MAKRILLAMGILLLCALCLSPAVFAPRPERELAPETETPPSALSSPSPEPSDEPSPVIPTPEPTPSGAPDAPSREEIALKYDGARPALWGEAMDGIVSRLPTQDKVVAITLDACGWGAGSGYDEELIAFLADGNIPATLFISGKWIEDNPGKLEYLARQENFEIENHGYAHKPLSVNGQSVYGIKGTASPAEVYDEIMDNARRIEELTGRRPLFFRTGTAYYDDVAVKIADELGVKIAGFTISGDGGATFSAETIARVCKNPAPGAILLFHMNHPESATREGIKALYKTLTADGYTFVKLEALID